MTPQRHTALLNRANPRVSGQTVRLDGLGIPTAATCVHRRRQFTDGTGDYITKKAATTPVGWPIPASSRGRAIAKALLRRAVPLPAQIIIEIIELYQPPLYVIPTGWIRTVGPCLPAGALIGHSFSYATCPTPVCGNLVGRQETVLPSITGMITIKADNGFGIPANFGRVYEYWQTSPCAPTTIIPYQFRRSLFDLLMPPPIEWVPYVAPELMPPTAPVIQPPTHKPATSTPKGPQHDNWELPEYGTERGPVVSPRPDYGNDYPGPPPAPNYVPAPTWDPWADPDYDYNPRVPPATSPRTWPTLPADLPGVPRTRPAPGRTPFPRPRTAPGTVPVPGSSPGASPLPIQFPAPATVPIGATAPGVELRIDPPGWTRQSHVRPGRGIKERKFILAVPPGVAKRVIGGVTEGLDMVSCLHAGLPKHLQAKAKRLPKGARNKRGQLRDNKWAKVSFKRKAAAVYKHYLPKTAGDLQLTPNDIFSAIVECGKEQFKDRIYAELGRAGGRAGRRLGLSHGFGLGGYGRGQATGGLTPLT